MNNNEYYSIENFNLHIIPFSICIPKYIDHLIKNSNSENENEFDIYFNNTTSILIITNVIKINSFRINFQYSDNIILFISKMELSIKTNEDMNEKSILFEHLYRGRLFHAINCPCEDILNKTIIEYKHIDSIISDKFIKKASVGLVFTKENMVLLTKRQSNLSFPNKWVFPGGQLDPYEEFENAVKREIMEEVGIDVNDGCIYKHIAYESTFPISIEEGLPKSHFYIMFYIIKLDKSRNNIKVIIDTNEVEAYIFIDIFILYKSILNNENVNVEVNYNNKTTNEDILFKEVIPYGHRIAIIKYIDSIKN